MKEICPESACISVMCLTTTVTKQFQRLRKPFVVVISPSKQNILYVVTFKFYQL